MHPLKKRPKTMLVDASMPKYIARSCRGSNSRRGTSTHSSVSVLTRIRIDDLLLAIARYSARSIGWLLLLADISASSSNPVKIVPQSLRNIIFVAFHPSLSPRLGVALGHMPALYHCFDLVQWTVTGSQDFLQAWVH